MNFYANEIEKIIGYKFNNAELLKQCFTHASYANEHKGVKDNERLEFLGDSVLSLVVSEYLFLNKKENEGLMTSDKQNIVSKKPLSVATKKMGIDKFLLIGGENREATLITDSLCENLFEAVVAGIYLDGGYNKAKKFIIDKLISYLFSLKDTKMEINTGKNALQEYCDKNKINKPVYEVLDKSGKEHEPIFTVKVCVNNICAVGMGKNIKSAEQNAADIILDKLRNGENV